MERVDVKNYLEQNLNFEKEMEARVYMINAQIDALERLIISGKEKMRCPTCWNQVVSLIDRLRYFAPAIWITAEEALSNIQLTESGPGCTDFLTGEPKQPKILCTESLVKDDGRFHF